MCIRDRLQANVRVNGFGFGADGSKETLFEFLSDLHRFEKLSAQDKTSLEAFLLAFPTETPKIVGKTITIAAEHVNIDSTLPTITALLTAANQMGCEVKLTGRLRGRMLHHTYLFADSTFRTDVNNETVYQVEELLQSLAGDDDASISMTVHLSR